MSYIRKETVAITTAADGSATAYTAPLNGKVAHVAYVKDTFDDGVSWLLTNETTGETIWSQAANASAARNVRDASHDYLGAAFATQIGLDPFYLSGDRVKIVIAAGGNVKAGTFHVYVE